jgi:transposase-like protein
MKTEPAGDKYICHCGKSDVEFTGVSSVDDNNEEFVVDYICPVCRMKYVEEYKQTDEPNFYKIKFYELKKGVEE